jgi:hypothetical protein
MCYFLLLNNGGGGGEDSIQFFIIYVPSQQLQGQLWKQHTVDTINYVTDRREQR